MNDINLNELENKIGYTFKDKKLLSLALTHSSFGNEHKVEFNERLEFLGDAVLELTMSRYLYFLISLDEGVLTKTRAKAVCEDALNIYAEKINLNKYIILGKGEELSGGRLRKAIIADAYEALLGAIFLDSGFEEAYKVVENNIVPYFNEVISFRDYKSILQEKLQSEKRTIKYDIIKETGPANDKMFEAAVYMDEILMGTGSGRTKKEAQQMAAKAALDKEARN